MVNGDRDEIGDVTIEWRAQRPPRAFTPLPGNSGWLVVAEFVRQPDGWVVSSCTVRPAGDAVPLGGISARELRTLNIGPLARVANSRFVRALLDSGADAYTSQERQRTPRPGRAGRDDHFYATWAARYVDRAARTPRPIPELAEQYQESRARVRDHLAEARRRRLLSVGTPGKAGGHLTPRATELLGNGPPPPHDP